MLALARRLLVTAAALSACVPLSLGAARNLYEWSAVAPIVVAAQSLGEDGKYVEVRVERVFRGEIAAGIRVSEPAPSYFAW